MSITGKVDAMVGGLRRENNALRKNYEKERTRATVLESRILHAFLAAVHAELPCPFCGAETGHVSPFARHIGDCVVETIELAAAPPPSVGGDDGGHIGAMPGYDPLTRSVNEPRPNTTRGLCPECLDDSGLDSLHKYGVMTEHLAQLAAALGLREGKHTADSVARIAIERLVLAPRSQRRRSQT